MDYSCGFVPQLGGSLRRTTQIRRSMAANKNIGGIDWHLRALFTEQTKCFEEKMFADCALMAEMQEFYKKRAQVEQDYSDALTKLANQLKHKHQSDSSKRTNFAGYSSVKIWNTAIESTQRTGQAHFIFSQLLSKQMVVRCQDYEADIIRRHKKIREVMQEFQNRVLDSTLKLSKDQKDFMQRVNVVTELEKSRNRSEEKLTVAKKKAEAKGKSCEGNVKYKRALEEFENKDRIYQNEISSLAKAKNNYLARLAATNVSTAKYFNSEVRELLECAEFGLHNNLSRLSLTQGDLETNVAHVHQELAELFTQLTKEFDLCQDQAMFFKKNEHQFSHPSPFIFNPIQEEKENTPSSDPTLRTSLETTAKDIQANIESTTAEIDKIAPELEAIESRLLANYDEVDYLLSDHFRSVITTPRSNASPALSSASILNDSSSTPLKSTKKAMGSIGNLSMISNVTAQSPPQASNLSSSNLKGNSSSSDALSSTPDLNRALSVKNRRGSKNNCTDLLKNSVDYIDSREKNRKTRIDDENEYFRVFAEYKSQQHRLEAMNARLSVYKEFLQKVRPTYGSSGIPLGKFRGGIAVLPDPQRITPQMLAAKVSRNHTEVIVSNEKNEASSPTSNGTDKIKSERKVLRVPNLGKPKLFSGSIDEYFKATGDYIPPPVNICINTIKDFGMHHQGVFRVPGSQSEINEMKAALERGESILLNGTAEARDINSTAGLLKMYFRDLGEKPFSPAAIRDLVTNNKIKFRPNSLENLESFSIISGILKRHLSTPVHVVMRYLFAFLNHLTEYSDDNMMDPYNLAICFGPTLMPIPSDLDPVQYQTSINDMVKNMIIYHEDIFDKNLPGPKYGKFSTSHSPSSTTQQLFHDCVRSNSNESNESLRSIENMMVQSGVVGDSYSASSLSVNNGGLLHFEGHHRNLSQIPQVPETSDDDEDDGDYDQSEDGSIEQLDIDYGTDLFEAISDFKGTTDREISFAKGDQIYIYRPMNNDWYEGSLVSEGLNGRRGLIPRLYVAPKEVIDNGELGRYSSSQISGPSQSDESVVPTSSPTQQSTSEAPRTNPDVSKEDPQLLPSIRNIRPRKPQAPQPRPQLNLSESELHLENSHSGQGNRQTTGVLVMTPDTTIRNTKSMICPDHMLPDNNYQSQQTTLQQSPVNEKDSEKTKTCGEDPYRKPPSRRYDLETYTMMNNSARNHNNNNNSPSLSIVKEQENNNSGVEPSTNARVVEQGGTGLKLSFADRLATFEKSKFQPPQPLVAPKPRNGKI